MLANIIIMKFLMSTPYKRKQVNEYFYSNEITFNETDCIR